MTKSKNVNEMQIALIIEDYYYETKKASSGSQRQLLSSLWEIVCDNLDIDYDHPKGNKIFDKIMEQYK